MTEIVLDTEDVDLGRTLSAFGMLPRDPTVRLSPGRFARATLTPEGAGQIVVTWAPKRPEAQMQTTGPGAQWLQRQAPALLGLTDDVAGFDPATEPLRSIWARHRGDRIAASGTFWHDLAFFIVQQRVARSSAAASWDRMVRALGTPAGDGELMLPPEASVLARLTYADLHPFGIERQRADNLIAAARFAVRLPASLDQEATLAALRTVRGIGPWTCSCLSTFTWGSPDTVITGDAGIPSMITWLLAREPRGDDRRMLALLEPYRPHRYRVIRLAFAEGVTPPRRGPRAPVHDMRRR